MNTIHLWVNGVERQLEINPDEMLSDVIRYRLGLTGTKIGCNEAECGSCTVLVEGEPILSCSYPAMKASGKHIVTIEGLARGSELHPLQEAFVNTGAVQCGFCIPGQIMTAAGLLEENPDPSDDEIKSALKDTLCRCGGYPTILTAVKEAGRKLRTGEAIPVLDVPESGERKSVGRARTGVGAVAKVTGNALYTDDISFPGMLFGRVLRAGDPHAVLKSIDISAAMAMEGVRAVLTAADIPGRLNHGLVIKDWPALIPIGGDVRYVGDALAIVAADTDELAQRALDAIDFSLESLPRVVDPVKARAEEAPLVHESGNLLKHIKVRKGDVEAGFAHADYVFEDTYHTPAMEHAFLEPECSIARPLPDGRMEVYCGSQIPYADREQVAAALDVPEDDVRIIGALIGGGFGGKEDIAGQIHAALLAQATGKPVKILFDRHESLLTHPKRHATQISLKIGIRRDGEIVSAQTELYGDTGAYASLGEKVMTRATTHSSGPYDVPNVKADCYAMYTNNPPAGAFRGFGVTQSCFAVESVMDTIAEQLKIDPVELRRINALQVGDVTNTGQELKDSVGLLECIDRVDAAMREKAGGSDPFKAQVVPGRPDLRRAWGFAVAYKNTGLGGGAPDKAEAEIELFSDGSIEARTSSADMGQGLATVLQLIAAEVMAMPLARVRVLLSDTDLTPDGGPTTASRQTYVSGNAVRYAAIALREAISAEIAEKYDVSPDSLVFEDGSVLLEDGGSISFSQVAQLFDEQGRSRKISYEYWAPETRPLGMGGDMHFAYSFAAQAAEVEVSLSTGEVEVLRVIAANDVGQSINPLGLRGQIEGGVIMGLGHTLTEEYITEDGEVFTDYMARYRVPSIAHMPEITPIVVEHPTKDGPYGAKGVGEVCSIPTLPAITNAICHACGVRVKQLPVDQDWIVAQLQGRTNRDA
ncbi:MAG: molybdopterin-dependent oxidoreductase [Anaerolineales bacterium]|nr:molybdopterin-dependent oxidoreductase [Anaerolineales bacterium]